jgi:pimeloyl-ACP methyl ester carboxylesterase
MVTKRARRWLTRGTTIAVIAIALLLVAATWVQGSAIERNWLRVENAIDEGGAVLERLGDGTVVLSSGDDLERPGTWLVSNRDGWVRIGAVVAVDDLGVHRELLESSGAIRNGSGVSFSRTVWVDPPIDVVDVVLDGPLGEHEAWVTEGIDDTWVIFVHGNRGDRSEALRLLPAVFAAGYPTIVPTYRNDVGAPPSKGAHHGYGHDEWRDIEVAVDYAFAAGARDIVLVGYGSGGSIAGTFLYESRSRDRVVAVVLDAPMLSVGIAVDEAWALQGVPGFIAGWAKAFATFRHGIDWAALDHVSRVHEWDPPVLILHGREDDEAPLRASAEFATARIDTTLLLTFPAAGHGASWNVDQERYEHAVLRFLAEHALGESEFEPADSP